MLLLLTLRNQIVKIMETGVRSKREMPMTQKTIWGKSLERVRMTVSMSEHKRHSPCGDA